MNKKVIKRIFWGLFTVMMVLSITLYGNIIFKKEDEVIDDKEVLVSMQEKDINETSEEEEVIEEIVEDKVETIKLTAVGDFLMHIDIVAAQYDWQNEEYNFNYNLELIKPYLEDADLTIANLETTLSGEESGYSGYPSFNTPDELADAMKEAGVDVVNNMSNHSLDKGEYGFVRTRQTLEAKGFDVIGTRKDENDKRYLIRDIKGINVGVISYSYTTDGYEGGRGLNGIPIDENLSPLMNTFNPYDVDADLEEMKKQINEMRNNGAEAIVFYMHWGEEYQLEPNDSQIKIAQFLADEGVDIIFGTHPHTIQPIDIVKSQDGSHETVVVYSMGNFISSQILESIGNSYTEDGLMVSVEITKNFTTGEIKVQVPEYIPTWVKLRIEGGQYYYQVVPAINTNVEYLTEYEKDRVVQSFDRTVGIVELYDDSVQVWAPTE